MDNDEFQKFINHISSFSDYLFHLSPFQFTMLGIVLGIISCEALTTNQQNSLGNFLEEVGQILLTYNAHAQTTNAFQYGTMQDQLNILRTQLNQIIQNMKK
ncbi:MAG: hypothetical protein E7184_03555 [Erysipelotrichaceae bacterium]|nr:hypothetical protein [Erysipelotrichaceae bacterium]